MIFDVYVCVCVLYLACQGRGKAQANKKRVEIFIFAWILGMIMGIMVDGCPAEAILRDDLVSVSAFDNW